LTSAFPGFPAWPGIDRWIEQLGFNAICFGLEPIMHAAKAIKIVLEDNSYRAALPLRRATRLASGTAQPCTCRPIVWALSL